MKAAIEAQGVTVYDGEVPDIPAKRYAVLYMDQGLGRGDRLVARRTGQRYRGVVHSIGQSPDEARWVAERVDLALSDVVLTVAGFDNTPCSEESSQPIRRDVDVPTLFLGAKTWTFVSTPTA